MAALEGFDTYEKDAAVTTPIILGATLLSVAIPKGVCIGGIDVDVSDLDSNATPLIALDVGDAADQDRYVAASPIARDGGLLEYRPSNTDWYRYSAASAVLVKVATAPATGVAGAIAATVYGYPSADVAELVRSTLRGLGVLAEGETARAEDAALALEALAEIHEMMRGKRIANRQDLAWPLAAVPTFAARLYAAMAGNLLAATFGLSLQRMQAMAARAVEAERELRRQTAKGYSGKPVSLEPYREPETAVVDYAELG
jgi:hypothetical protein